MNEAYDLVVVLPVGPNEALQSVIDTVSSIAFYTNESSKIIILDDSLRNIGCQVQNHYPEADVLIKPESFGRNTYGGLYLGLSQAFMYAYEKWQFHSIMKMDVDALFIGSGVEHDAVEYFRAHPGVGMLGSYRLDCNGDHRDFTPQAAKLRRELYAVRWISNPGRRRLFGELIARAESAGYEMGENCQGGAYLMSHDCIRRLIEAEFLLRPELRRTPIGDDTLFPLLTRAVGLRLADFATDDLPLGLRYRGLPDAPGRLVQRRKKIVHSVRFWQDMRELEIRQHFRNLRESGEACDDAGTAPRCATG